MILTNDFRLAWTEVALYIRRHLPARRLRPNEFTWLHDEALEVFRTYLNRGASTTEAADMAKASILLVIIST